MELIFSIILAAGAGKRMGRPKALVSLGNRTFLSEVLQATENAGLTEIAVILAHGSDEILKRHDLTGVRVLHNLEPAGGPISSIQVALRDPGIQAASAVLIHPVDHPRVKSSTLELLVSTFRAERRDIVVPTFQGRGGHPTLFSRKVFPELLSAPRGEGARAVVRRDPARVLRVEVEDGGVRQNLDTPEDLVDLV